MNGSILEGCLTCDFLRQTIASVALSGVPSRHLDARLTLASGLWALRGPSRGDRGISHHTGQLSSRSSKVSNRAGGTRTVPRHTTRSSWSSPNSPRTSSSTAVSRAALSPASFPQRESGRRPNRVDRHSPSPAGVTGSRSGRGRMPQIAPCRCARRRLGRTRQRPGKTVWAESARRLPVSSGPSGPTAMAFG